MTDKMLPFRELLKPHSPFNWNDKLCQLFEESKKVIIDEIQTGVQIFDKSKPTCLATDWSKVGIGFWLFQKHFCMPAESAILLPHRLEDHTGWQSLHTFR